jgi:hypothetical protein
MVLTIKNDIYVQSTLLQFGFHVHSIENEVSVVFCNVTSRVSCKNRRFGGTYRLIIRAEGISE